MILSHAVGIVGATGKPLGRALLVGASARAVLVAEYLVATGYIGGDR